MAMKLRSGLLSEFAGLMAHPRMDPHERGLAWLERSSLAYIHSALRKLGWGFPCGQVFSTGEIASNLGVVNRHRRLLERLLTILAENNFLKRTGSLWEVRSRPEPDDTGMAPDPAVAGNPETLILKRCGPRLPEVLQGKLDPLQLLFPDGDVTMLAGVYRECAMQIVMNTLIQKMLSQALRNPATREKCRILEIGAGTGGTTAYLLSHLSADRTEYVFTDVSVGFTSMAQRKFTDYPFVDYRVLNIEQEPHKQGFENYRYDVVIAANVFHATRDLAITIRNARHLLAPGGFLVLIELTAPICWLDLTFGLTQGWWRFDDTDLRPSYPLLSAEKWVSLLKSEAFDPAFSISSDDLLSPGGTSAPRKVLPLSLIVGKVPTAGSGS